MTEHQQGSGNGPGEHDPTALPPQAWDPPPWPPPSWPEGQAQQPFGESASFVPTSPWVASSAVAQPPASANPPTATEEWAPATGASPVTARPEGPASARREGGAPSSARGRGSRRSSSRRARRPGDGTAPAGATAPVAGWAPRAGAGLVDAAVALVPSGALLVGGAAAATSGAGELGLLLVVAGYLVALGVGLWNHVLRQGSSGRTLGKSLVGLRLVGADADTPVGEGVAAVRVLAHVLDTLPLGAGWLWPLVDPGRRTVADAVCGTRVVRA